MNHSSVQHVLHSHAQGDDRLDVGGRTSAQGTRDLDGRTSLAALRERDAIGATLVRDGLPSRTVGGVERARAGDLPRLLTQVGIRNASTIASCTSSRASR